MTGTPSAAQQCGDVPQDDVSAVRQAEAELDAVIAELDRRAVRAMADGDPTGARLYADRMYAAISCRTPEHQHRLHAQALQRIRPAA